MASHDYVISNDTGANVRADINSALQAILTHNSVSGTPSTTAAHQIFADTSVTGSLFKVRNAANGASASLFTATGLIKPADGSSSDVALGPSSDIDTGFHFATAATIAAVTAGTERVHMSASETVFNETGADTDFRIEGTSAANAFFVQGSDGFVGLGTGTPSFDLTLQKDAAYNFVANTAGSSSTSRWQIISRRARGTNASPSATSSGDSLLNIRTDTYHSTGTAGYATSANIEFLTDGAESGNTVPTAIRFQTMVSGGANTERMRITSDGLVGIGVTPTVGSGVGLLHIAGTGSTPSFALEQDSNNVVGATAVFRKSRGSIATPSAVSSGDFLMVQTVYGYQNSAWQNSGSLSFAVSGTPSGNYLPTSFSISTHNVSGTNTAAFTTGITASLTNNSATTVLSLTAATLMGAACIIRYSIEVTNGTDIQMETGSVYVSVVNKGGSFTTTINEVNSQQALSAGTLATTWAVSSANPAVVSVNANSSLSSITAGYPRIKYTIDNLSQQSYT